MSSSEAIRGETFKLKRREFKIKQRQIKLKPGFKCFHAHKYIDNLRAGFTRNAMGYFFFLNNSKAFALINFIFTYVVHITDFDISGELHRNGPDRLQVIVINMWKNATLNEEILEEYTLYDNYIVIFCCLMRKETFLFKKFPKTRLISLQCNMHLAA